MLRLMHILLVALHNYKACKFGTQVLANSSSPIFHLVQHVGQSIVLTCTKVAYCTWVWMTSSHSSAELDRGPGGHRVTVRNICVGVGWQGAAYMLLPSSDRYTLIVQVTPNQMLARRYTKLEVQIPFSNHAAARQRRSTYIRTDKL